jgi:hypothetical protein
MTKRARQNRMRRIARFSHDETILHRLCTTAAIAGTDNDVCAVSAPEVTTCWVANQNIEKEAKMGAPMSIPDAFLATLRRPDLWSSGSYYELVMELSPGAEKSGAAQLLQAFWHDPQVVGVVHDPNEYGQPWRDIGALPHGRHDFYGCLRLDDEELVGCASLWSAPACIVYIPIGMFELIYPVDYPLTAELNPWLPKIDRVLAHVGMRVYQNVRFELGALGEEASGFVSMENLSRSKLANDYHLLVPDRVFERFDVSPRGLRSPEGLWWTGETAQAGQANC